jgi:hypothetical protein
VKGQDSYVENKKKWKYFTLREGSIKKARLVPMQKIYQSVIYTKQD